MNREIIFRGKRKDNGVWISGVPVKCEDGDIILVGDLDKYQTVYDLWENVADVLPETVGQYTGLTDKNGKKIFEGDIIKYPYHDDNELIVFYNGAFGCTYAKKEVVTASVFCSFDDCEYGIATDLSEVIGNIHDNPELLKGE